MTLDVLEYNDCVPCFEIDALLVAADTAVHSLWFLPALPSSFSSSRLRHACLREKLTGPGKGCEIVCCQSVLFYLLPCLAGLVVNYQEEGMGH